MPKRLILLPIFLAAFFSSPIFPNSCADLFIKAAKTSPSIAIHVVEDLRSILRKATLGKESKILSSEQYDSIVRDLLAYAKDRGINIHPMTETIGVFPKGLYEIGVSGFNIEASNYHKATSFVQRHELAHLFHTIEVRAILIETLKEETGTISPEHLKAVEEYLVLLEGPGRNYRQFEKAVTSAASPMDLILSPESLRPNYVERLNAIIDKTSEGLLNGKISFPTGHSARDIYGLFMSKAPLVVGYSGKGLAARMPFLLFSAFYASNWNIIFTGNKKVCGKPLAGRGFRDVVNEIVFDWKNCLEKARL